MGIALGRRQLGAIGDDAATLRPILSLQPKLNGQTHGADGQILEAGRFPDFAGELDGGVGMVGREVKHLVSIVAAAGNLGVTVRQYFDAVGTVDESERMRK